MFGCLICMFVFMLALLNLFAAWRMFARQSKTHVPVMRVLKQLLASDLAWNVTGFPNAWASCSLQWRIFTGRLDRCLLVPSCRTGDMFSLLKVLALWDCVPGCIHMYTSHPPIPLTGGPFSLRWASGNQENDGSIKPGGRESGLWESDELEWEAPL